MHRNLRILILLLVLAAVAGLQFGERLWVRSTSHPMAVAIYPIAADSAGEAYLARVKVQDYAEIATYLASEQQRWLHRPAMAPRISLQAPIHDLPPLAEPRSAWEAVKASLRLRWYAFRHTPFWASLGTIRLFVLFHEARPDLPLPDSHGMQKGLVAVVHVFASDAQRAQNNVVITHELLHVLGASDKYDASGLPRYPIGFADPYAQPLFPQNAAEIMAGRIAVSATRAEIPNSLADTTIGYATAAEIGW
jgi:hypothetical protein